MRSINLKFSEPTDQLVRSPCTPQISFQLSKMASPCDKRDQVSVSLRAGNTPTVIAKLTRVSRPIVYAVKERLEDDDNLDHCPGATGRPSEVNRDELRAEIRPIRESHSGHASRPSGTQTVVTLSEIVDEVDIFQDRKFHINKMLFSNLHLSEVGHGEV